MPSDGFAPPAVPAASNDAGPPVTPSGAHASNPAATVIIKTEAGRDCHRCLRAPGRM